MKETESTFETFIDKMGNNVLKLLGFFYRKEAIGNSITAFLFLTFFRLKICINAHKTSNSTYIFICESL